MSASSIVGFAERLKQARLSRNISQKELAARIGVQPSMISCYENDQRSPSLSALARLSTALSVSTDYLLGLGMQASINCIDITDLSEKQQATICTLVETMKHPE